MNLISKTRSLIVDIADSLGLKAAFREVIVDGRRYALDLRSGLMLPIMAGGAGSSGSLHDYLAIEQEIPPQGATGAVNGNGFDIAGYLGVAVIFNLGATSQVVDAKMQHDGDSGFSDPTDYTNGAMAQLSATDDNKFVVFDIPAEKVTTLTEKFQRLVATPAGATAEISATALLYKREGVHPPTVGQAETVDVS